MNLFAELDYKETREKAKTILKRIRMLENIVGSDYAIKVTATYSLELKSNTGGVSDLVHKAVEKKIDAEIELTHIVNGINAIPDAYIRQVIIEKYKNKRYGDIDVAIYMGLNLTESEFYRLHDKGLMYFAECYKNGELLVFEDGDFWE